MRTMTVRKLCGNPWLLPAVLALLLGCLVLADLLTRPDREVAARVTVNEAPSSPAVAQARAPGIPAATKLESPVETKGRAPESPPVLRPLLGKVNYTFTKDTPLVELEEKVLTYMQTPTYKCKHEMRMGNPWDGGWDVCLDKPYFPDKKCLVYSFGIRKDWSFDEAMEKEFDCEVHSFDPSIGKKDHKHSDKVFFHNLGVSGKNWKDGKRGWDLKTVESIRAMLKHNKRSIDVLKMDVEKSEWTTLEQMFETDQFNSIRQFCFELHRHRVETRSDLMEMYALLQKLYQAGLRLFKFHANRACGYPSLISGKVVAGCYELYYINTHFKKCLYAGGKKSGLCN